MSEAFGTDITFKCPGCKQSLAIDSVNAGFQVQCPTCNRQITAPSERKKYFAVVMIVLAVIVVCGFIAICLISSQNHPQESTSGSNTSGTSQNASQMTPERAKAIFTEYFNGTTEIQDEYGFAKDVPVAQLLFDRIHPVGTATNITVNDLVLNNDADGNIQTIGLDLTLYWRGPLQDGTTEFKLTYDTSDNQFKNFSILRTDGITREDVDNFTTAFVIGAEIHDALSPNQNQ